MASNAPVVVVGAGLSGLVAARHLARKGIDVLVFDSSDAVGGRVRTDEFEGFQLDRGFQVLLSAYPTAQAELDYEQLRLSHYEPGARVWLGKRFSTVSDPIRKPSALLQSAFSSVGSITDKLRILKWRHEVLQRAPDAWFEEPETSAWAALSARGFSDDMMRRFFQPFYGGVFLESKLETSSRMLNYTFSMFTRGTAAVPERGMQAIPEQLAACLPSGTLRLNRTVVAVTDTGVRLRSGEQQEARAVLIATEGDAAYQILGKSAPRRQWKGTTCLYFNAPSAPPVGRYLVLNGSGQGPINNLSVPTNLAPELAPLGRHLISATVLGPDAEMSDEALFDTGLEQLEAWFGPSVKAWNPLKAVRVPRSLPAAKSEVRAPAVESVGSNVWMCGDHVALPSIEGAMASGLRAAEAIVDACFRASSSDGTAAPTSYSVH